MIMKNFLSRIYFRSKQLVDVSFYKVVNGDYAEINYKAITKDVK
jgi:hypothetical protein